MRRPSLPARVVWALTAGAALWGCDEDKPPPVEKPVVVGKAPKTPDAELAGTDSIRLTAPQGEVRIERGGEAASALEGTLRVGDVVETGRESGTVLRLADGREIVVGAGTRVAVKESDGRLLLEVLSGSVVSRTPAEAGPSQVAFAVLTPEGLTRIAGLTEVSITVNGKDGQVEVDVRMGDVQFMGKDGVLSSVVNGERLLVDAGKVQILKRGDRNLGELSPIEIVLHRDGPTRASIRKAGAKRWTQVSARELKLEAGDSLRADKGRAKLSLGSSASRVGVEAGSELTVVSAAGGSGMQQSELDLRKGALDLALDKSANDKILLPGVAVASATGGQFLVRKTRTGYDVEARTGDLDLERDGVTSKLPAGSRAQWAGKAPIQLAAIPKAVFSLPSRRGQRVFHSGIEDVSISWEGNEGDAYQVEVAEDDAFREKLLSGLVHRPTVNVPSPSKGSLYWRVRSANGGAEVAAGSAIFAPEKRGRDLALLRNEVPEDAEKTSIFFQDKPPALTFIFKPEEGAANYRLRIYRADSLTKPVVERTAPESKAVLEAGALSEGAYVWSATPLSADDKPLRSSRMTPLELSYDNAVPTLVVLSPDDGARISGRSIEASGIAPMGSRIFVNGQAAPLDDKHRFKVSVAPLSGPPPLVVFKMAQPGGPDVFRVRKLRRGP